MFVNKHTERVREAVTDSQKEREVETERERERERVRERSQVDLRKGVERQEKLLIIDNN